MGDRTKGQGAPWRDEEMLREEYVHKQRSSYELAEEWGCSSSTVLHWVRKYRLGKYSRLPRFITVTKGNNQGYETLTGSRSGDSYHVIHHRLLAVAEWGFDAVADKDVHHKNGIRWDNRPENLELLTKEEHTQEHEGTEIVDGEPWYAEDNLRSLYHDLGWSLLEIANEYGVVHSAVRQHMEKHGIERRSNSEAARLQHQGNQQQTLDSFAGDD